MNNFLKPLLSKADSMPFLFLGSGFSRRYLKTPSWMELLEYIANLTFNNETGFQKVKRKADKKYNIETEYNSYMTYLCDLISDELDEIWYEDERFTKSRQVNWDLVNQSVPPIKIEIANYLKSFKEIIPNMVSELTELENISPNSIAGIITTNYDTLQEDIFDYEVYSSQEELLFHTKYDLGEIYKIHGSVNNPDSILINTSDYEIIEQKHKYIAAKLLTIFVEHPIFFIGYSIGDEDIRRILNDIQLSLTQNQLKEIEDRLFYVVWNAEEETFSASTYIITFENGRSITIKQISLSDYSLLYKCLSSNKAKYPIKILRHVKQDMYNLVLTNDPSDRLFVNLPETELTDDDRQKIEYVTGFGVIELAKLGYLTPKSDEIYHDIVFDDANYNPDSLLQKTIIELKKMYGVLPVFKYLASSSDAIKEMYKQLEWVPRDFSDFKTRSINKRPKQYSSVSSIVSARLTLTKKLQALETLHEKEIVTDDLGAFLKNTLGSHPGIIDSKNNDYNAVQRAAVRRLIREYDYLKYK
ncbi:SIR2 family protein [Enterococcus gilvus]|uniref:SIR2 family protein n=1 Tax=Enterococcus gilvus TaxID=160453 RepID=UPI002911D3DA|nr:SIR2 family protein [Enterococcus gilvus]MDU5509535.1 SIR2 family protein [Enterococcus gilvus]